MKKNKFSLMNPSNRTIVLAVFLLGGALFVLHQLTEYSRGVHRIMYSTFLEKVDQDQVKQVHIAGQEIHGVLKDGTRFETISTKSSDGLKQLRDHNVVISAEGESSSANTWYLLLLGAGLSILAAIWYSTRQSRGSGGGAGPGGNIFSMGKSKARIHMPSTIKDSFNSVAGAHEAKEELHDIVDYLRNPEKYKRLGAKMTRGVLLVGAPGNGKTLLARAVAGEANCPFLSISGSDFIEVFVGVGAARVRDLFAQARKHSPSIIFIDEIDAVGRQRGSGLGGGHDEREQTLNQLLTEMDGFQTDTSVVVLAATNRPDVLDNALLRPGRFDRRVDVPYPDLVCREQILNLHAKGVKVDLSVDMKKIARGTTGFSGADLANLINEAAILASKHEQEKVLVANFEEARDKILLGKEHKTIKLTEEDRKLIAFHEAGHALMRILEPSDADPLYKITIVPRGRTLGVTHFMPEREKHLDTKDGMMSNIKSATGGRAAEALVFNKATSGSCNDFEHATGIARRMVCAYGMSDEVGHATYFYTSEYSQATAEKIDNAISRIVNDCYQETIKTLTEHRDKLDKLANTLLEKETLYADEVYELLEIKGPEVNHRFS